MYLAALRQSPAAMTPGSDPLPALKAPGAHLCGEWTDLSGPVLEELREWAGR